MDVTTSELRSRLLVEQLVAALQRAAALAFAAGLDADSKHYLAEADRHAGTIGRVLEHDPRFEHPDERRV